MRRSLPIFLCCSWWRNSSGDQTETFVAALSKLMDRCALRSSQSVPLTSEPCSDGSSFQPHGRRHCHDNSRLHLAQVMQAVHGLRSHRKLCDVVLKVEDREIPAHRAILAAISPYFMAMFTGDMVESTRQEVTIRDVSYRILSQIVDFVYTAQLLVSLPFEGK